MDAKQKRLDIFNVDNIHVKTDAEVLMDAQNIIIKAKFEKDYMQKTEKVIIRSLPITYISCFALMMSVFAISDKATGINETVLMGLAYSLFLALPIWIIAVLVLNGNIKFKLKKEYDKVRVKSVDELEDLPFSIYDQYAKAHITKGAHPLFGKQDEDVLRDAAVIMKDIEQKRAANAPRELDINNISSDDYWNEDDGKNWRAQITEE